MSRSPRPLAGAALLVLAGCGSAGEHQGHADRAHPGADGDLSATSPDGSAVTRLTRADSEEQEPALTRCKGAYP